MKMQAYLGPNKPETLAVGEGDPSHEYAVIRDSWQDGITWIGTYPDERSALGAVDAQTTHKGFGVLCLFRPVDTDDVAEFIAARPDLRVAVPATPKYKFIQGIPVRVEDAANV